MLKNTQLGHILVEGMEHREERCFIRSDEPGSNAARIPLDHLAVKGTVEITRGGNKILPKGYNKFGEPIFDGRFADMQNWEDVINGNTSGSQVVVTYKSPKILLHKIDDVDSTEEIARKIETPDTFWKLLEDREILAKGLNDTGISLSEYVVFGCYLLEASGKMQMLKEKYEIPNVPKVCTKEDFLKAFHKKYGNYEKNPFIKVHNIPTNNICPLCAQHFTDEDVKNRGLRIIDRDIAHKECVKMYETRSEIYEIIHQIISIVYKTEGFTYDILPIVEDTKSIVSKEIPMVEYCGMKISSPNQVCAIYKPASRPVFQCHTPDGDIRISRYGGFSCYQEISIVIEWLDNFKQFDMSVFSSEDVSKWNRGIVADGIYSARKYLQTAKDIVNLEPIS